MRPIIGQNPDPMVVLPSKYQVWSNVLGKSLTTVDTDGGKLETQVYAGGALIATQVRSTMSDNVVFHTADPVTGTTMLMHDTGTGNYKEESEPLGQRIEPVDPSPGYPSEYSEITDIASQPEWNCTLMKEVSGGFFNMPVECQKKEAELMNFSIEGALRSMEPENPQRISADHELGHALPNDSGTAGGQRTPPTLKRPEKLTPEELARRRALAATGIFDNEGGGDPLVLEGGSYREFFNVVDANGPGIKALHFKDNKNARGFLSSVLNNGNCKEKIEELIKAFAEASGVAAITSNLESLFDSINSQEKGGFTFNVDKTLMLDDVLVEKKNADWGGVFSAGNAKHPYRYGLATRVFATPQRVGGKMINFGNEAYVLLQEALFNPDLPSSVEYGAVNILGQDLIHELLHVAASKGTYDHDDNQNLIDAVKGLGFSSVNQYLQAHCNVPQK